MSIAVEKFKEIVDEVGLPWETQSAFHKVTVGGRAVYVAKTKKVSRVDISGFDGIKHPAVKRLTEQDAKDLKLGKVRAQIDFSKADDRILEAFRGTLEMMVHLSETEGEGDVPTLAKKANKKNRGKAIKRKGDDKRAKAKQGEAENHQHA
jgi:hypothetical protein